MIRSRGRVVALGLLTVSVVGWLVWSVLRADARGLGLASLLRSPYAVAPLTLLLGLALGRAAAHRPGPARAVVLAGVLLTYVGVVWTLEPGKAPLGYANANAALAVQLIALSGLAASGLSGRSRWPYMAAGALGVATVIANSSRAAIPLAVAVTVVSALAVRALRERRWPVFPAALIALTLPPVAAAVLVRAVARDAAPAWLGVIDDPTRRRLWRDAWTLWERDLERGQGPGAFAAYSPLARDADTASAHSLVLQVGAETGWVGLTLLAGIWGSAILLALTARPGPALIALAAWTGLALHALIDHLVDFAPVMLAAGAVLGWAAYASEELDIAEGEPPG